MDLNLLVQNLVPELVDSGLTLGILGYICWTMHRANVDIRKELNDEKSAHLTTVKTGYEREIETYKNVSKVIEKHTQTITDCLNFINTRKPTP